VNPATYQRGAEKVANWRIRDGLYASRKGSVSIHDTTPAAARKLVEVIEEAANRWAETPEAREEIRTGAIRSLSNDARSDEEKIEEKEKEIAELRAKVKARDAQIAKLRK
jgi:peptidoglycan hydrolase CwlO-like protein